jgi:hypothetical protein
VIPVGIVVVAPVAVVTVDAVKYARMPSCKVMGDIAPAGA